MSAKSTSDDARWRGDGVEITRPGFQRVESTPAPKSEIFRCGDLMVDLVSRTVKVKGEPATLTPIEYSLLHLFVQNAGKVLTHRQIFREIRGTAEKDNIEYIRVYLTSLRSKLARELIVTEPGIGYRLELTE
jgi:two-component system, OmpR family, KDP operon response regulator KdpE